MASQYFGSQFVQSIPASALPDTTPPTFAGVTSLTPNTDGSITVNWAAATDSSTPITYPVYIAVGSVSAAALFVPSNMAVIAPANTLTTKVFLLGDQTTYLINGTTYTIGVRAIDAYGNVNTNTTILTTVAVASGNLPVALQNALTDAIALADSLRPAYVADGAFVVNHQDLFQGTFWMAKNGVVMTSSLGTASYQIYDKTGAVVANMSESGITADANGQFKITPVASTLGDSLEHYIIEVTIDADSVNRVDNIPLIQKSVVYKCHSVFSINGSNQLLGTLWASIDDEMAGASSLGTAAYTIYDATGAVVPGMSQSGIVADSNGRFIITPVASTLADLTHYTVKVSITVDGQLRISNKGLTLAI